VDHCDAGFSLLELTIALGLTLAVTTTVVTMVHPARGAFAALPEGADMQQRLRVGVDTLTRDLMLAGAGSYIAGHSGPLNDFVAPVMPFRRGAVESDPAETFRTDAITVISVPPTAAQTTLAADLTSGSLMLRLAPTSGCPTGVNLCRFTPGMTVLAFDETGAFDLFTIATVVDSASQIAIAAWPAGSSAVYKAGAPVAEAQVHTYFVKNNPATKNSQLMHHDGSANAEAPVVDHVVGMAFEYYGESQTRITAAELTDGPWLPTPASGGRWDADLRRIRAVGVTLRVEAALAALRGPAGTLFSNGGTATAANAWMPDQEIRFQVSPRNLNLSR
jgi:Tfp pilus assembly protein PilW